MLKARTSFPSVIYENNEHDDEPGHVGRVVDIMARYYARIGEIIQAEIMKQNEKANIQPADNAYQSAEKQDMQESLDIIQQSKQKVKRISTTFSRTDDDMKKLEREVQILSMVRKNLDNMTRKFWD